MRKKKDTHSFDFRPLGLAIREAREKAGLSRNDLGDKVFYGERHIADIENIGKHPSFQLFHDLVTMFNISVDEYFYPAKNVEKNFCKYENSLFAPITNRLFLKHLIYEFLIHVQGLMIY